MLNKLNYIFTKKDKWNCFILLIVVIIGSFLELAGISIFSPFVELIMNPESIQENAVLSKIYELSGVTSVEHFLALIAVGIIVIYVVKNVYVIIEKNQIYIFSYKLQRKISTGLLNAYMNRPYSFHLNKNISVLQRSIQEDTEQFTQCIIHLMEMIAEVFVCVSIAIYLFDVSKSIMVIIAVLLGVCMLGFYKISKKYSVKWGRQGQEYRAYTFQWMNQSLGGIKELKVLNREESFVEEYDSFYAKYVRVLRLSRLMGVVPKYIIEMVSMTGLLLAVIIKIFWGQKDLVEFVPQLAVFAVAAFRLLPSVGRINEHLSTVLYAKPSVELIYNDLKEIEKPEIKSDTVDESWHFKDKIEAKKVTYAYPGSSENVIEDADFVIKRGTTAAFVGASGAGKTTMVDIILGLFIPQKGKILADGMNIFKNLRTWQKEIGYIPQSIYLSDDTIERNVAFGVRKEDIDEEAVLRAVKQAQLFEFIDTLPDGLQTYVGDRGVRLSGGQRQRIGIARALYHNPQILVLDEATSALDNDTEKAVMEAIDRLKGEKTIIVIAHRLSTVKDADAFFEVKDGKVYERTKQEVMGE